MKEYLEAAAILDRAVSLGIITRTEAEEKKNVLRKEAVAAEVEEFFAGRQAWGF